jgi:hypothetical protein
MMNKQSFSILADKTTFSNNAKNQHRTKVTITMRSKTRTTVAAEQDKTNERKQATKKSSKAKTIATQRNSTSGEERDEAASTRLPDDELPHVGSRRSDLPQSFETEEMAGTPSAVSFDRDQQKRHGLACKQMRVSFYVVGMQEFHRSYACSNRTLCRLVSSVKL